MTQVKTPGRMKKDELLSELVTAWSYNEEELTGFKWAELINMVKASRAGDPPAAKDVDCEHIHYDPPTRLCISCGARAPEDLVLYDLAGRVAPEGVGILPQQEEPTIAEKIEKATEKVVKAVETVEATVSKAKKKVAKIAEAVAVPDDREPLLILNPDNKDYRFNNHAGMGPSASSRWLDCTASIEASREFLLTLTPNQQEKFGEAGDAALQGTTAHTAAEAFLLHALGKIKKKKRDKILDGLRSLRPEIAYDGEMEGYVHEYVDLVMGYVNEHGMEALIEMGVETSVRLSDGATYVIKGSADAALLPSESHPGLVVIDLKYGSGHDVDPEENPQAMDYGLGVIQKLDIEDDTEVTIIIAQPRLGGTKAWKTTAGYLREWGEKVLAPAAEKALAGVEGGAEYKPSESNCVFCPAAGACSALAENRMETAKAAFEEINAAAFEGLDEVNGALLTDERLGEVLNSAQQMADLFDGLKAEAERRLLQGKKVPNYRLVSYSPVRMWEQDATETLVEVPEVWKEPALLSPAKALAAVKGNEAIADKVADKIVTPDKRPILGREGSKQAEWVGNAPEELFAGTENYAVAEEPKPKKAKKKGKKK